MLTAKDDDADRIVGLEFGADDYVPKPCTPRELVARVRAILPADAGRRQYGRCTRDHRSRTTQASSSGTARGVEQQVARPHQHRVQPARCVDELLTLSRVEAGMAAAHQENIDLVELVGDVVKDATFEADAGSLSVEFATDVEALAGLSVRGDPAMLHRALENVVRNGARHTPSGSRVRIVGQRDAIRREIELTVEDEGPGVAANELESIFAPFYRGAEAKGTRGHGLGLAIARRVIEGHGGSIHVTNRASGGLSVHIRTARVMPRRGGSRSHWANPPERGQAGRIGRMFAAGVAKRVAPERSVGVDGALRRRAPARRHGWRRHSPNATLLCPHSIGGAVRPMRP